MAFYAELVRRNWYTIYGVPNMIHWYNEYLYETWFNSLSEDERQRYLARLKDKEKRDHDEAMRALYNLMSIPMICSKYLSNW